LSIVAVISVSDCCDNRLTTALSKLADKNRLVRSNLSNSAMALSHFDRNFRSESRSSSVLSTLVPLPPSAAASVSAALSTFSTGCSFQGNGESCTNSEIIFSNRSVSAPLANNNLALFRPRRRRYLKHREPKSVKTREQVNKLPRQNLQQSTLIRTLAS
jgi:hypothetical protein